MGKKVLVLSGGIDTLVPWAASKQFVENLWVGNGGVKRVLVVPDAGHECTAAMVAEAAQFHQQIHKMLPDFSDFLS